MGQGQAPGSQLNASMANLLTCFKVSPRHACLASTLAIVAVLSLFLALFGPTAVQHALDAGVHKAIVWAPDSPEAVDVRYRGVCDPKDPRAIYSNVTFYLYNITNVDAMRQGAKPAVALVGPYNYIKVTCKLDVWWDADGHVSAKEYTHYEDPLSGRPATDADLDANITTLNLALAGVVETIHATVGPSSAVWLDLLVTVLAGWKDEHVDGLFVHRTARELLWGYEDPLLTRLASILPAGIIPRTRVQLVTNATGSEMVHNGPASMYDTGSHGLDTLWEVLADKNLTQVTAWPGGDACVESVRGTDGTQFRPALKIHDRLQLWMSALFRSTELISLGPQFFHGIKLLRFWPDPSFYAIDPCKQQRIRGLLNITAPMAVGPGGNGSMAFGPPILVSRPHFCYADPSLRKGVTGLPGCGRAPDQLVYLDIEPITGITMRALQSIMVSSQITESVRQHLEPRINSSAIIPMFWSEEAVEAPEQTARDFVRVVYGAKRIKAHLHLWPLLFATACASACACVLVHASVMHLQHVLKTEEAREEEGRQARRAIIERAGRRSSMPTPDRSAHTEQGGEITPQTEQYVVGIEQAGGGGDGNGTSSEAALKQPLLTEADRG